MLFLEASDAVLVQRFENVRRPHPMQGAGTILDGIAAERELLREIRGDSDIVLDTSVAERARAARPGCTATSAATR